MRNLRRHRPARSGAAPGAPYLPGQALRVSAAYLVALAYFTVGPNLPTAFTGDANFVVSAAVGLVVAGALVVLSLPFMESGPWIVAVAAAGALLGIVLTAVDAAHAATVFKVLFAAATGFFLSRYVPTAPLVYAIALVVLVIDIVSVMAGPTKVLIEEHQQTINYLSIEIPEWGDPNRQINLGISDLIFLAAFLGFTWRFGLRRRLTAVALVASLLGSLAIGTITDRAVPALPLLSLALVVPNADIVFRQLKKALQRSP